MMHRHISKVYPYKSAHDVIAERNKGTNSSNLDQGKYHNGIENDYQYAPTSCNDEWIIAAKKLIWTVAIIYVQYRIRTRKIKSNATPSQKKTKMYPHLPRGGEIDGEQDMTQILLKNINTSCERSQGQKVKDLHTRSNIIEPNEHYQHQNEEKWEFLKMLSSSIRVDEDENGSVLFRRKEYGLLISKEELAKCLHIVQERGTIEDLNREIELQALYEFSDEEAESTAGMGFCSILALIGALYPPLNSVETMNSESGRNTIADVIEEILIPSVRDYIQPDDFSTNPKAHEHGIYKEHTIEHLSEMISILRDTTHKYIDEEQWMYAAEVGIVVQAMPIEATYWQEIRSGNWIALNLWSTITTGIKQQTIKTLQETLKGYTKHIAYAKSHFFNTGEIRTTRYRNILIEILNAIIMTQDQEKKTKRELRADEQQIQEEDIDEGSIAVQKDGAHWFMSLSKRRVRELGRMIPSQVREELIKSKSTIQISKSVKNINWELINGDNYCGYQALHAIAMHSEGRTYSEINTNIQTRTQPYKLISFLQKQLIKLQDQRMKNALRRTTETIQNLKSNGIQNRHTWCPTEMIDQILPSIHYNSNFWNHERPPTGSKDWITTYYNEAWVMHPHGMDIIFNGTDHYTIHLNNGIPTKDLIEGIDRLVDEITQRHTTKSSWQITHGNKVSKSNKEIEIVDVDDTIEPEYIEFRSKRTRRIEVITPDTTNHGHSITKCTEQAQHKQKVRPAPIVTPVNTFSRTSRINYAPVYHPLDDAIPSPLIPSIPFPKTQRSDPTARKDLVVAPSRIGSGHGVYTLSRIPKNVILMEYIDEANEIIMKKDLCEGLRDTTYMYANHKTNTYINASNNKHSYCGLVNEALEDQNFNTIICESRDSNGRVKVYYKTTREISAREEIGTRYSIDGSYWDSSKTYSDELLEKVRQCYAKEIPFQRPRRDDSVQQLRIDMSEQVEKRSHVMYQRDSIYATDESEDDENDISKCLKYNEIEVEKQSFNNNMDISESDDEIKSDEGHYTNTIYQNKVNIETNLDGTYNFYNMEDVRDSSNVEDDSWNPSSSTHDTSTPEHTYKTSNQELDQTTGSSEEFIARRKNHDTQMKRKRDDKTSQIEHKKHRPRERSNNKKGKERTSRQERRNQKERSDSGESTEDTREAYRTPLVEYVTDQKCRHKKDIDQKKDSGSTDREPSEYKKRALDAVKKLINPVPITPDTKLTDITQIKYSLRPKMLTDYTEQLDEIKTSNNKKLKKPNREPERPRYILHDSTATNPQAFMVACSSLKHAIKGVFAREAIPLGRNRTLFEYTSEHNHGTNQTSQVEKYLGHQKDNKFLINVGNIIVDATDNVRSYCNHVQELLSHATPFNCKYVKAGNKINIVQISPIAKNEELNIQYSKDGSYWKNRTNGYPEEILKKARKYYKIDEPIDIRITQQRNQEIPNYRAMPRELDHKSEFNLMDKETLFRWDHSKSDECNLRIATLNMNGALFDTKNGEPAFILQIMTQCGINVLGITDARIPADKADNAVKAMKYPQPRGTAVICFPTKRLGKDTTRLTTMGGQMIIIDKQWEPMITSKRSDESGLSLIVSLGLSFQQQSLIIIQVMVPPPSLGQYTMWSRITKYLEDKGIKKTPRDYVLDTASKWQINAVSKGRKVILMGDFNRTHTQLSKWQADNNLQRAHEKIDIAQVHPGREMCTYLRNSTTRSHIDHIYHTDLHPHILSSVGATDHIHIHEKTDHFPIWIAINWKGYMEERQEHKPSPSIRNKPDLDLTDTETVEQFAEELDQYIEEIGDISTSITPERAGCIQAAIYAKSAEIAQSYSQTNFQTTRPKGIHHRYKDGFSPAFRVLQESLHAYVNLGRVLARLNKRTHTATVRLRELKKIYPRWKKIYDKYYIMHPEDHVDKLLYPLDLNKATLRNCKLINISEKVAQLKARMHGRQRTILRAKLSERCKTMQHSITINKLKKVIQMIIPSDRSALDYAATSGIDGQPASMKMADLEANRIMKNWMSVPEDIHYISQDLEDNKEKWKMLLNGTYQIPDSDIPIKTMKPVVNAFKSKNISNQTRSDLHQAMHMEFTFAEFNKARKNLTKNKSPGPSGVTNNQMRSWNEKTARAIFELSSIMWKHHSVPQFWQDRLMTLLPKTNGVNDLTKVRPISLFENIRKLWAGMVSRRIQTIWNKDNILHANQHGFRWQRGTHTAVMHLLNQLELADELNPVYLTMWDIRRAFDSVPKWLQRLAWARLGLQIEDLEWFLQLDSTGNIYIRTPEFEANRKARSASSHLHKELPMLESNSNNFFHPERGVGQGDTPSSLIFIAVFDILLTLLDESGTGQPHAYADDLAHIATTQEDQQTHADLVSAFCVITGLEVATAKVEAIALNHGDLKFTTTLIIRDWWWVPHLVVQSDKDFWTRYLGIYLDSNLCKKHYDVAINQYKMACNALIHRTAPSSAKKMVHTLCLRPKIRYIAALSPWTLQQYHKIDQVPYQLFCQIYGLRRGFPLALVYTPIMMGGCGDIKLSDEANSMKWKILHSCIHLGGLSKQVSNDLIKRAIIRRENGGNSRGYADSMIEWCIQMGLQLTVHSQEKNDYTLKRISQLLSRQDPTSPIRIYSDGAYDALTNTPLIDKLTLIPTQLRQQYGIGRSSIYIEGTQQNGVKNRIAMQIEFQKQDVINTTPFLQELIGIAVGFHLSKHTNNTVMAYTDCKAALAKVRDTLATGSKSILHLPYAPIIGAIKCGNKRNYQIEWTPSHPEKKKKIEPWTMHDHGIYRANLVATGSMKDIREQLPTTTIIKGSMAEILKNIVPTDTWIWSTTEGVPVLESLRARSSLHAHRAYLNRRDTLRNKGSITAPSRWSKYNMYHATYFNGSRSKCSTRVRGHQCKQMYDWTTHSVNLAKGVEDDNERAIQSTCKLCCLQKIENQIHTSTTCSHPELMYIRNMYRPEIENILKSIEHIKVAKKERWAKNVIAYVSEHLWKDTQRASDIWNGRWSCHMWEEAMHNVEEKTRTKVDTQLCRKWLRQITSKLFETQSALSRHRFKLSKRLKDPMFERPQSIPALIRKRINEEYGILTDPSTEKKKQKTLSDGENITWKTKLKRTRESTTTQPQLQAKYQKIEITTDNQLQSKRHTIKLLKDESRMSKSKIRNDPTSAVHKGTKRPREEHRRITKVRKKRKLITNRHIRKHVKIRSEPTEGKRSQIEHINKEWKHQLKPIDQEISTSPDEKNKRDEELQTPQKETQIKSNRHTPADTKLRKR